MGPILYFLGHVTKKKVSAAVDGRFLEVAARLFKQRGFEATTVREIARAAGMLPGSLHYRYPTKDSLLLALMRRGVEADMACMRAAIADSRDPVERLHLALRARVRFLLSKDSASVVLFDWRSLKGHAREEMIRLRDAYEAFWIGLINEAAGAGRLRPGLDLKLLRLLVFGAVNWVALWYSPRGERSPDEIADAFWAFIAYGVFDDAHRPADVGSALRELSALEPWGPRRLQGGLREGRK
jgi:TetR/AcrR family transcriptional regulator, cholesterol catabolism regulator